MSKPIRQKEIKFPKNREIAKGLQPGDRVIIAEYASLSPLTIRDMMNGYRRITDATARAIIRLKKERAELWNELEDLTSSTD